MGLMVVRYFQYPTTNITVSIYHLTSQMESQTKSTLLSHELAATSQLQVHWLTV